jgi:hypothetical protein
LGGQIWAECSGAAVVSYGGFEGAVAKYMAIELTDICTWTSVILGTLD